MTKKRQVFYPKLSQFLSDSNRKKKKIVFLTLLGIAILFGSTVTSAPGNKASEIQDKLKPNPDRFFAKSLPTSKAE